MHTPTDFLDNYSVDLQLRLHLLCTRHVGCGRTFVHFFRGNTYEKREKMVKVFTRWILYNHYYFYLNLFYSKIYQHK